MKILCPHCKNELIKEDKRYYCKLNHSFDIAKEGYLNLNLKNSNNTGDEKEMIRARRAFLEKDYYLFLRQELNRIIDSYNVETLVDLACGEGYYTKSFEVNNKIGIDLSKEALKIASKKDKTTNYILKNIFELPLEDESVELVTTIFAPISSDIKRILKNNGHFILVRPDEDHLFELKKVVYEKPYLNEIDEINIEGLSNIKEYHLKEKYILNNEDLTNLFKMTPYYHKTSLQDMNKLNLIDNLEVTFAFIIDDYLKS